MARKLDTSEYKIPVAGQEYNHPEEGNIFIASIEQIEETDNYICYSCSTNPPDIETLTEYDLDATVGLDIYIYYREVFTLDSFVDFEIKHYSTPNNPLRYGQEFTNTFGQILSEDIFYVDDISKCKNLIVDELISELLVDDNEDVDDKILIVPSEHVEKLYNFAHSMIKKFGATEDDFWETITSLDFDYDVNMWFDEGRWKASAYSIIYNRKTKVWEPDTSCSYEIF